MILSLVAILLVIIAYMAVKTKIQANDLKRQISDYDENSYS